MTKDYIPKTVEDFLTVLRESRVMSDECLNQTNDTVDHFAQDVFDFTTYDSDASYRMVNTAIDLMNHINTRKPLENDDGDENYIRRVQAVNWTFFGKRLMWGTSVRGAWWHHTQPDITGGMFFKDGKQITTMKFQEIKEGDSFINTWNNFSKAVVIHYKECLKSQYVEMLQKSFHMVAEINRATYSPFSFVSYHVLPFTITFENDSLDTSTILHLLRQLKEFRGVDVATPTIDVLRKVDGMLRNGAKEGTIKTDYITKANEKRSLKNIHPTVSGMFLYSEETIHTSFGHEYDFEWECFVDAILEFLGE